MMDQKGESDRKGRWFDSPISKTQLISLSDLSPFCA